MTVAAFGGVCRGEGDWKIPANASLLNRWAGDVSTTNALPEYPRSQMLRDRWLNLNGLWEYGITKPDATNEPAVFAGKSVVPYPIESVPIRSTSTVLWLANRKMIYRAMADTN